MPSENPQAAAYLQTKVMSASPEELRLMLLDGAIKFCRQGRDGLAAKNYETCHHGFSRCRAILVELISSMRTEIDPALCERLTALYVFMINQLIEASHTRNHAPADKVIELLEYDRETWVQLMERLAQERADTSAARARAAGLPPHDAEGLEPQASLSVSG
jgi:flagellar protein FliS